MVNPGAFIGSRRAFLVLQKPAYTVAVVQGSAADSVANIQRRFFKRFPIDLDALEEPSKEALLAVDDDGPDPEPPAPDEDSLNEEEYVIASDLFCDRKRVLKYRSLQIKRWMAYQYAKDHPSSKTDTSASHSLSLLTRKISGNTQSKPRQAIPYNLWAKENGAIIEEKLAQLKPKNTTKSSSSKARKDKAQTKDSLKLRSTVTRDLYSGLAPDVQLGWKERAEAEHLEAVEAWEATANGEPSTDPVDRQRCIEGLSRFAQPILDLICAHTGMKATLIVGGPEPADGGRLNVMGLHSGHIQGPIPSRFGQVERIGYKQDIMPVFSRFLKKCYTMAECRARALPTGTERPHINLADDDVHGATTIHRIEEEWDTLSFPAPPATDKPPPTNTASGPLPTSQTQPSIPHAPTEPTPGLPRSSPRPPASPPRSAPCTPVPGSPPRSPSCSPHPPPASTPRPLRPLPASSAGSVPCSPALYPAPALPTCSFPFRAPTSPFRSPPRPHPSPHAPPPRPLIPLRTSAPPSPSPSSRQPHSPLPPPALPVPPPMQDAPVQEPATAVSSALPPPKKGKRKQNTAPASAPAPAPAPVDEPVQEPATAVSSALHPPKKGKRKRNTAPASAPAPAPAPAPASAPAPKRQKKSPANTPAWLQSASGMFQSAALGNEWEQLVELWETFEALEGFGPHVRLAGHGRPPCIADWIRRARSPSFRPTIRPDKFADAFDMWWRSLQPSWRRNEGAPLARTRGNYDEVRRPGINGIISVLAALFFWGV